MAWSTTNRPIRQAANRPLDGIVAPETPVLPGGVGGEALFPDPTRRRGSVHGASRCPPDRQIVPTPGETIAGLRLGAHFALRRRTISAMQ